MDRVVRQGRDEAQPAPRAEPADPQAHHPLHVQGRGVARRSPRAAARTLSAALRTHPRPHPGRSRRDRPRDPAQAAPRPAAAGIGPLLVAERAALAGGATPVGPRLGAAFVRRTPPDGDAGAGAPIAVLDPVGERRAPSAIRERPTPAARSAPSTWRRASRRRRRRGLVTAPVSKASIARHASRLPRPHRLPRRSLRPRALRPRLPDGLSRARLQVALLTVHGRCAAPRRRAAEAISRRSAARRHAAAASRRRPQPPRRRGGPAGDEEANCSRRRRRGAPAGLDACGGERRLAIRARPAGEFDWVLALYHDQGLIAVKTAPRGEATNWTLGLPFLRTSVDHGTAFALAGRGVAADSPLRACFAAAVALGRDGLPRGAKEADSKSRLPPAASPPGAPAAEVRSTGVSRQVEIDRAAGPRPAAAARRPPGRPTPSSRGRLQLPPRRRTPSSASPRPRPPAHDVPGARARHPARRPSGCRATAVGTELDVGPALGVEVAGAAQRALDATLPPTG